VCSKGEASRVKIEFYVFIEQLEAKCSDSLWAQVRLSENDSNIGLLEQNKSNSAAAQGIRWPADDHKGNSAGDQSTGQGGPREDGLLAAPEGHRH
jgi:hypothetical protein